MKKIHLLLFFARSIDFMLILCVALTAWLPSMRERDEIAQVFYVDEGNLHSQQTLDAQSIILFTHFNNQVLINVQQALAHAHAWG